MKIGVLGAGAIGCYVGGKLAVSGADVVMVGRLGAEIAAHGLVLTDLRGGSVALRPDEIVYRDDPAALEGSDAVLVAVKSMATEEAARSLAAILTRPTVVVSLQNGVENADVLRHELPGHTVLRGTVSFNVARQPDARFRLATSGPLAIERAGGKEERLVEALRAAGFDVECHDDLLPVQWSKLLINLNNSINALAGVPLREQLGSYALRRASALTIREALACMKAAGIKPARVGRVIPSIAPLVLGLPNFLFFMVARTMVKIDPAARSSMWEDLERRRATEIDFLNGAIVRLGERVGVPTPVNRRITDLVKEAEKARAGSPCIAAERLLAMLTENK